MSHSITTKHPGTLRDSTLVQSIFSLCWVLTKHWICLLMVMTLFLHTKTPGGKLCFCYSQPIENGILNTWHQVTVTFSEANSIWKYFHFQQSKGQVIIRWRWPINNTNTAGYYLPFWKLTAYSAIKKGFYNPKPSHESRYSHAKFQENRIKTVAVTVLPFFRSRWWPWRHHLC